MKKPRLHLSVEKHNCQLPIKNEWSMVTHICNSRALVAETATSWLLNVASLSYIEGLWSLEGVEIGSLRQNSLWINANQKGSFVATRQKHSVDQTSHNSYPFLLSPPDPCMVPPGIHSSWVRVDWSKIEDFLPRDNEDHIGMSNWQDDR